MPLRNNARFLHAYELTAGRGNSYASASLASVIILTHFSAAASAIVVYSDTRGQTKLVGDKYVQCLNRYEPD